VSRVKAPTSRAGEPTPQWTGSVVQASRVGVPASRRWTGSVAWCGVEGDRRWSGENNRVAPSGRLGGAVSRADGMERCLAPVEATLTG
jgi:hypothetical protein